MTILEKLQLRHGNIEDTEIDEMIEQFGEDFQVVVKYCNRNRQFMTLRRLKRLSVINPELDEDILEVFISSTDFERLFG